MDTATQRHHFEIPIGDWSDDGHGKCDHYIASAAKPIEDVREAFFAAQAKHPDLDPTTFCSRYQDRELPEEIRERVITAIGLAKADDFDQEGMAKFVIWFLNQGDPDLDVRAEPRVPSLAGFDKKRRHIGFIGYGLF